MTQRAPTALAALQVTAWVTRLYNWWTNQGGVVADILDSMYSLEGTVKTDDYTVVTTDDSGKVFRIATDAKTFTLPAIAIGNTFTFYNDGADGAVAVLISPNSSDGIAYAGSQTDDKDIINTKATANKGDYITLASLDQAVSWQVTAVRGIWAKVA